jgi:cell division inhibitor SepF
MARHTFAWGVHYSVRDRYSGNVHRMSAMRKMAVYLGLVDDGDSFDEYEAESTQQEPARRPSTVPAARTERSLAPVVVQPQSASLDRIITIHPRTYNEARQIGEVYREGVPVIMNLTDMDDNDAKRLVDFGAGLVFGLHGTIERVTAKVFLLSPANVSVSMETKHAAAEASFFNQS